MIWIVEFLSSGEAHVLDKFVKARAFWDSYFSEKEKWTAEQFAAEFASLQAEFEAIWDNKPLAEEMMPLTCLSALYNPMYGFASKTDLAKRVVAGFRQSGVSPDIRTVHMDQAVTFYDL